MTIFTVLNVSDKPSFEKVWKRMFPDKPVPKCTCEDCPSASDGTCAYAWDLYNTDGDCLAVK